MNGLLDTKPKLFISHSVLILYLKRYQLEDGDLVKNDSAIEIEKYLTLNWLCDEKIIELPEIPVYDNIEKTNDDPNKPLNSCVQITRLAPLRNREPNVSNRKFVQFKPLSFIESINSSNRPLSTTTPKPNRKLEFLKNPSPSIDIKETEFPTTVTYNQDNYALTNMTEEEQMKLALDMSLRTQSPQDDDMDEIELSEIKEFLDREQLDGNGCFGNNDEVEGDNKLQDIFDNETDSEFKKTGGFEKMKPLFLGRKFSQ
jgi:hypothetical protein